MKCDFCDKEVPEDELAVVEATPQDENGNAIGETKSCKLCEACLLDKMFCGDPEEIEEMLEENWEND